MKMNNEHGNYHSFPIFPNAVKSPKKNTVQNLNNFTFPERKTCSLKIDAWKTTRDYVKTSGRVDMDVSKNRGILPPKWMVYNNGKPYEQMDDLGVFQLTLQNLRPPFFSKGRSHLKPLFIPQSVDARQ